jgi:CRISPR-associated Csx2 family protein
MKIISFLGMGKYQETKYIHPLDSTKQCLTPFFQEALVEFYNPEKLYVLLTDTVATKPPEGASESNWECLQQRLRGKVEILPIYDIPEKNSPDDIWQIFQKVNDCLEEGDSVIFDITHSFRSVPVVALISVSYLRIIRQVKIDGLLYGAFEAKNKEKNETPTYDLLPILMILTIMLKNPCCIS